MFSLFHSITNEEQYEKQPCNQSSHYGKIQMILQYVHREATDALPQIDTLRYQQKEMGNKGRTKVIKSFVNTAVCQKASVRLK